MLVESLMIALVEHRVLGAQQVIEAVETVIDTKRQFVEEGSHPQLSAAAAGMATTLANSLAAMAEVSPAVAGTSPAVAELASDTSRAPPIAAGASGGTAGTEP